MKILVFLSLFLMSGEVLGVNYWRKCNHRLPARLSRCLKRRQRQLEKHNDMFQKKYKEIMDSISTTPATTATPAIPATTTTTSFTFSKNAFPRGFTYLHGQSQPLIAETLQFLKYLT